LFLLAALLAAAGLYPAAADGAAVDMYVFWRPGCPHCERELAFLARIQPVYPTLRIHYFNVWEDQANVTLLRRIGGVLGAEVSSVPFTVVGDQAFGGYLDDASTGAALQARVDFCVRTTCPDSVAPLRAGGRAVARPPAADAQDTGPPMPATVRLPVLGTVATRDLSLPALTVVLGALDGFNPCAMWVLVMLLGLLIGIPDRRRRWVLGGVFILASAVVYFVFMAAWLNLFLFLGMLLWVRAAIALVALGGGAYYLYEFLTQPAGVCKVTAQGRRRRVFDRLKDRVRQPGYVAALAGIVVLAFAVNLVELLCSAGIPAVYTRVLSMSRVPAWQYYGYMALYILVFMLDDLVVFFTAMKTLELTGLGTGYAHYSRLIGGVVLLLLGTLLLLRPEWLVFA
jgi:glutaredoxin